MPVRHVGTFGNLPLEFLAVSGLGDLDRARDDLDEAIRLGHQVANIFRTRAEVRAKLGDSEGTKADRDRAARLGPK
jgi:hypothetical protein